MTTRPVIECSLQREDQVRAPPCNASCIPTFGVYGEILALITLYRQRPQANPCSQSGPRYSRQWPSPVALPFRQARCTCSPARPASVAFTKLATIPVQADPHRLGEVGRDFQVGRQQIRCAGWKDRNDGAGPGHGIDAALDRPVAPPR